MGHVVRKNRSITEGDMTVRSSVDGTSVTVTVGQRSLELTEEEFLGLYDMIGHVTDWKEKD